MSHRLPPRPSVCGRGSPTRARLRPTRVTVALASTVTASLVRRLATDLRPPLASDGPRAPVARVTVRPKAVQSATTLCIYVRVGRSGPSRAVTERTSTAGDSTDLAPWRCRCQEAAVEGHQRMGLVRQRPVHAGQRVLPPARQQSHHQRGPYVFSNRIRRKGIDYTLQEGNWAPRPGHILSAQLTEPPR